MDTRMRHLHTGQSAHLQLFIPTRILAKNKPKIFNMQLQKFCTVESGYIEFEVVAK